MVRDPFCVVDGELRFAYVNAAAEAYMGQPAAVVLGRRMGDVFPQFEGSPLQVHLHEAWRTQQDAHFEIESRLRPGTFYEVHVAPGEDGLLLYYRDVTARRRDAQALAMTEGLLRVARGMAHVGSWIVEGLGDLETAPVTWSDETFRIFGYLPGEVTPSVPWFLGHVHPADRPRVEDVVARCLATGDPYEVEHRLWRKDGALRVLHQWGVIESAPDGRPLRVLGACQDVTDARSRETALQEAREQLQFVTDTMAAQVARCSRDLRYLWVSRAYAQARGFTPEQMVGRRVEDVLGPTLLAAIRPHIERVLRGEHLRYEQQVDYPDRGATWIEAHYEPTFDEEGACDGWVAVVMDVDARRRAEEALRDADRRKDEFLAVLAHELRNPLAPILNSAHLLRLTGAVSPAQSRPLEVVERQVRHMSRLLDDLLDVSRISRGKVLLRREPMDLASVVRATTDDLRSLLEQHQLTLVLRVEAEPVPVLGDATRLAQVLGNLLQNARKFTNTGGHVTVTLRRDADAAVLTVADDGIGMDAEILGRLFEPFSQADRTLDRSGGGLGLGLALVRGLVALHDGTVTAASEGPGHGSTFTVRLPLAPELPAALPVHGTARPARRRRVLVVEDNADVAESLSLVLESFGHEVTVARNGPEAVDAARAQPPEIVLCDIGLPGGMDGYAVARALRAQQVQRMHLVAVSGYGQAEDKARAAAAGFDRHLTKPLDPLRLPPLFDALD